MTKLHTRHEMFSSINACFEILQEKNVFPNQKICMKCKNKAPVTIYSESGKSRIIYRCKTKNCQSKQSVYNTKLLFNEFCLVVYKLILGVKYSEIITEVKISARSLVNIRYLLQKKYKTFLEKRKFLLGGPNCIVQCDESVMCRRGTIKCPSTADDNIKDTVWILGCIDNSDNKNFFVQRVENRKINTLSKVLESKICVGSMLYTDGYKSYPKVAENLALNHRIVNHSEGFKSADGTNTNGIEGFWAILKDKLRREHGVMREKIDDWLVEFTFYRRYVQSKNGEEISYVFFEILKLLIND